MNALPSRPRIAFTIVIAGFALTWPGCAGPAASDFVLTAERTDFVRTGDYAEAVASVRAAEQASPWVRVVKMGTTPEGRDMPLVIVSRERAFTSEQAAATGKAIVLINNGIHSGEIEGKDASLQLLREIAITKTHASLLDHVILLIVPIFSIDGHERSSRYNRINQNGPEEMGCRCTAQGYNLNRDFIKADALEMRHWLRMYHAWRPHFWFDTHTTDGADWQYDVTFIAAFGPEAPASIAGWVKDKLHPHLLRTLAEDGHCPQLFFDMRDRLDPSKSIASGFGGFAPRFSTMYGAITNRPSLLVETHMLKPYGTRVRATHQILVRSLELINAEPAKLIDAVRAADEEASAFADPKSDPHVVPLATVGDEKDEGEPVIFKGFAHTMQSSEAAGGSYPKWEPAKPIDVPTKLFTKAVVSESVRPPRGYLIPPQWIDVIAKLELHGLRVTRLKRPLVTNVEVYRFADVHWSERPFEGRHMLSFKTTKSSEMRRYPAGSAVVMLDQPMSRVAVHMLEPDAPDSLVRWGFFDTIFEQKEYFEDYCMAPIADAGLQKDESLRGEFEAWLKENPDKADNVRARLQFFYQRSSYWDENKDVYPIGRYFGLPGDFQE
ncbi:MAG: M14 family metallopeptidase [Planctomycetia bacterium]|jgi:hypothetical protein|nr:M14 family metallopeptidase [Planctomycetia bacterium]MCC7314936.1 M14 family metallopeptidase [Planctomycetota bacterium]